jgi:transposase
VEHYVGIDISLELLSVCVVDGRGKVVKEAKVASEPEALVCFFKELGVPVNRRRDGGAGEAATRPVAVIRPRI